MKRIFASLFLMLILFSLAGCVTSTNVMFNSDVSGAEVYVDGELIGTTPAMAKLSNAIWEDPTITLKKEGYQQMNVGVDKELKGVNLVLGLVLDWPALLFCYGPKANQYFVMVETPEENAQ